MTLGRWNKLWPLLGLTVAGAALMTACPGAQVTVTVTGPTQAPPVVRSPPVDCPSNQYYRVGRYHWRKGRYVFARGRCMPRPAAWHRGCRWVGGKWVQRGRTYRWTAGRNHCPRRAVLMHPRSLPPPPRPVARKCGPMHYAQHGHWKWVRGQWRWQPGRCVARTTHWTTRRCRYQRGAWRKVGNKVVHTRGRVVCAQAKAPVHPTKLPPKRRIQRVRCGRGPFFVYPGGWKWSPATNRYVWQKGKCMSVPRRFRSCRFVRGSWRLHKNGRAIYTSGGWRCRGKAIVHYSRAGVIGVKSGGPKPRRCTKAMQRAGRCGRPVRIKACKKNYYRYRGKCVRRGVRRCTRAMRKAGRCR